MVDNLKLNIYFSPKDGVELTDVETMEMNTKNQSISVILNQREYMLNLLNGDGIKTSPKGIIERYKGYLMLCNEQLCSILSLIPH